jgi:hypothetical protein
MRATCSNVKVCNPSQPSSSCLAICGTHEDGCTSHSPSASAFLRPFARRALPRFTAHMAALTSGEQTTPQVRPAPSVCVRPFGFVAKRRHTMPMRLASSRKGRGVCLELARSRCFTYPSVSAIPTPTTLCSPMVAFSHYPSAPPAPPILSAVGTSPCYSGLVVTSGRIEFDSFGLADPLGYSLPCLTTERVPAPAGRRVYT